MVKLRRAFLPSLAGLCLALGLLLVVSGGPVPATLAHPSALAYELYHPQFFKEHVDHDATLYLQNTGDALASVMLTFHDVSGGGGTTEVFETVTAGATLKRHADDLPQLADGAIYSLIVSSDQPVESVVQVHRSSGSGDRLGAYRGLTNNQLSTAHHFGPFYKAHPHHLDDALHAILVIWNPGQGTASVQVRFFDLDGALAVTSNVALGAGEQHTWPSMGMEELPDGFAGWAWIQSDQPVTGLLLRFSQPDGAFLASEGPLGRGQSGVATYLPRALKGVDEGGGPRTTTLFVGNTGAAETTAVLNYRGEGGNPGGSRALTVSASGAQTFDLAEEVLLPGGEPYAVTLESDQPLVIGEMTDFEAPSSHSAAAYGTGVGTELSLPRLARTQDAHTVFSVQSLAASDADVTIDYRDLAGQLILSEQATLPPGAARRYDQRDRPALGDEFQGSATITANQPVIAWVDEYHGEEEEPRR
jgi:hypothetical protein